MMDPGEVDVRELHEWCATMEKPVQEGDKMAIKHARRRLSELMVDAPRPVLCAQLRSLRTLLASLLDEEGENGRPH